MSKLPSLDREQLAGVTGAGLWNDYVVRPWRYVRDTIRENLPYPVGPQNPNPQLPGVPIRLPSTKP